jgi:hypothetical protein
MRERSELGQGTLSAFRERLIAMTCRMLERTVELAKETGASRAEETLRLRDSRPLTGAGRVEDTFNLIAHAARKLLASAAALAGTRGHGDGDGAPLLASGSIKAKLDIEWSDGKRWSRSKRSLPEQAERPRCPNIWRR